MTNPIKTLYEKRNSLLTRIHFGKDFALYPQLKIVDEELIHAIATRRKLPPCPLSEIHFEGKSHRLQHYDGVTATYVLEENFDPDTYFFCKLTLEDIKERVRQEVSAYNSVLAEIIRDNLDGDCEDEDEDDEDY